MPKEKLTLGKESKLKSKTTIDRLFSEGKSIKSGPVVLLWCFEKNHVNSPIQIGFSVPKRRFKRAVDRNRMKRQMKEVYRLNQLPLYTMMEKSERQLALFLLYRGSEATNFKALQGKIIVTLNRLEEELIKELEDE